MTLALLLVTSQYSIVYQTICHMLYKASEPSDNDMQVLRNADIDAFPHTRTFVNPVCLSTINLDGNGV
jgi:hypothetical protein